jgi:hypothetical protein
MKLNINVSIIKSESSATQILFHATNLGNVLSMVKENSLALTTGIGTESDGILGKKLYYLSMSRTRLGRYHAQDTQAGSTLITLNGDLLNQRYQTKPVDYWGEEYRNHRKGAYEEEDRLFSNSPTIPNANKYIKNIDVLMPIDELKIRKIQVRELLKLCHINKISCFIYENPKDWLIGNRLKAMKINISGLAPNVDDEKKEVWDKYSEMRGNTTKDMYLNKYLKFRRRSYVRDAVELYYKKSLKELSPSADTFARKISRDWVHEMFSVFSSEVHNERSNAPADRKSLNALIKILLKNKINNKEFYDLLVAKWQPIINAQD